MANDSEGNQQQVSVGYIEAIKPRTKLVATGVALRQIHCGKCNKFLFRGADLKDIEIKCHRCKHINRW